MNVVRPTMSRSSASRITASVRESIDAVGSSRIRMPAFFRNARAMQSRWRSPPDRRTPRSPICVSYPSGKVRDEFVRVGGGCGRDDLVRRGVEAAVADVVGDRAREQQRLLRHDADVVAERLERERADVAAVDEARAPASDRRSAESGSPASSCPRPWGPRSRSPGLAQHRTKCASACPTRPG